MPHEDRRTIRERRVAIYKICKLIVEGSARNTDQTIELNALIHDNFEWLPSELISLWFPVVKARNTEGGVLGRERKL